MTDDGIKFLPVQYLLPPTNVDEFTVCIINDEPRIFTENEWRPILAGQVKKASELQAEINELKVELKIALEALSKLGRKWLYWPAKKQIEGQPTAYESRTIQEIEDLATEALLKIIRSDEVSNK